MKQFKIKITRACMEELQQFITLLITIDVTSNDDKLFVATMAEVGKKIEDKLGTFKQIKSSYSLSLNTAQAIAMVILHDDYCTDIKSYLGNHLHSIANTIKQKIT